jgi:hypothetical protein
MTSHPTRFCVERNIPPLQEQALHEIAIAENPANAYGLEAVGEYKKLWRPGRVLRVHFLGGDPHIQARVARVAKQWSDYANITFDFDNHPEAEIRIAFADEGSWSYIGVEALLLPQDEPTMNFGWLMAESSDEEYSEVVLHEFGHALGLVHEHQSPASPIHWNHDTVVAYLSGPPNHWDAKTIELNVFERYSVAQTQYTRFDPHSIMLYVFPPEFTLDRQVFSQNTTLSSTDKEFIARCYPFVR